MTTDFLDPDEQAVLGSSNLDGGGDGDNLVLNLDEVSEDAPTFEALPPGIYDCIVENTELGYSSNNNPMITWVFKVIHPQYDGRLLFNHTVLNNKVGQSRLKQSLVRIVPDVNLAEFSPRNFCDEGIALGLPCRVKVRIRPYRNQATGKTERRNNVVDVLSPAEETGSFLDDN